MFTLWMDSILGALYVLYRQKPIKTGTRTLSLLYTLKAVDAFITELTNTPLQVCVCPCLYSTEIDQKSAQLIDPQFLSGICFVL